MDTDDAVAAFTGAYAGGRIGSPAPRTPPRQLHAIPDDEFYASLRPQGVPDVDCTTCDDARYLRAAQRERFPATVQGVEASIASRIPCPDCNQGSAAPQFIQHSRVQPDWHDMTIDDFRLEPGKVVAGEAVLDWVVKIEGSDDPPAAHMLMFGGNGVGKTMLASIMVLAACRMGHSGVLWNVGNLMRELQSRFGSDEESAAMLMKALGQVPVLALDDWGQELKSASGWSVSELEALIDERYVNGRATIVTTNLMRAEFADHVEGRVASRFLEFTRVDVGGDDMRGKK